MHKTRAYSKPVVLKFYRFLFFGVPLLELLSGCKKNESSLVLITNNDSREQIEQLSRLHNQISKSTVLCDNKRLLKLKGELKVLYKIFKKSALPAETNEKPQFLGKTLGFIAQTLCWLQYMSIITAECSSGGDTFFRYAKIWCVVFDELSEDIFYNLYRKQRQAKEEPVRFLAFPTTAFVSLSEAEQVVIRQLRLPITSREEDVVNQFSTLLLASKTANGNELERKQNLVIREHNLIRSKVSRVLLELCTTECKVKSVQNTKSLIWCSSISSRFKSLSNFILCSTFSVLLQHSRLEKMFAFRYAISTS